MLHLTNDELEVDLLDPASPADQARQGTRFCWGGYVWQVHDRVEGPLLTGPEWPKPDPDPYHGQGMPESFRHGELPENEELARSADSGFILGVGETAGGATGRHAFTHPCEWALTRSAQSLEFCTQQSAAGVAVMLTRAVHLSDRTVVSASSLTNTGDRPLKLTWFAHPFFALMDGKLTCDLPAGYGIPENAGFTIDERGRLSFKRPFVCAGDNAFQLLQVPSGVALRAIVSHPRLMQVKMEIDFTPDRCPVWGNHRTWSIEPYIIAQIDPGEQRRWSLRYEFGALR